MHAEHAGKGWPRSIIGIFIFLSIMLFGILYVSLKYIPVNKENQFMHYYLQVDRNINQILTEKRAFDAKYNLIPSFQTYGEMVEVSKMNGTKELFPQPFKLGKNNFSFKVTDKSGQPMGDAKVAALLTRYETSEFDMPVAPVASKEGTFTFENVDIEKTGRWKLIVQVQIGDLTTYHEYRAFVQ